MKIKQFLSKWQFFYSNVLYMILTTIFFTSEVFYCWNYNVVVAMFTIFNTHKYI